MGGNREGGGISNEGYFPGIPVELGKNYIFSFDYRLRSKRHIPLEIRLESADGSRCYAKDNFYPETGGWKKREGVLHAEGTDDSARLVLISNEPVNIELDMISLFPQATFYDRKNGLRLDIARMISDMKPRFMRFPGGCLIHSGSLDKDDRAGMYRWKNTVGPLFKRPTRNNRWGYNQSMGLGFYEYFQFCEDIGAKPLPVISAGYDPHCLRKAEIEDMQEWIDDALDLIEFANGDKETYWGLYERRWGIRKVFIWSILE
ncbi:hypothetical protein DWY69_00710 [Eisenbergiella massiliensis]|uniref:Alpha-L-arabinofuranosidase 1 catalytic domain-containing protein n=1 Tax=Eisenbergiella massiliensis TaxID=1720294 RepID=A0A3E3J5C6_9FIRM|nr:hypothetical protein DWY69_00710 [Eisenbergiella massiliensis]